MTTQQRIAITGGRGRLAGLAAAFFRKRGYDVVLFSRTAGDGFQLLEMLLDPAIMGSFDALFHTAWSTVPFTSEANLGSEEQEDLPLLKKLLETLVVASHRCAATKFIFISSASVYGNQLHESVTETTLCAPLSAYARGKINAEKMILQTTATLKIGSALEFVILRVTNVIGFSSNPERPQGILPRIIFAAQQQQTLEIWGDGCCSKDYLWIDDFLSALEASLMPSVRGVFNIGSGENFSLLDFISMVEQAANTSISVAHRNRYPWDVSKCAVTSSAFSKATGWKPEADIREEIRGLLS